MRDLKSEELSHVYGAGGRGKNCHTRKGKHGTGSKGRGSHGSSGRSKHRKCKRGHGST
jgi:hypothetical protein